MIGIWLACKLSMAGISVDPPPAVGTESVVVLTDSEGRPGAGETVRVVHRPGMAGEAEIAIGITDTRGKVRWKPGVPGLSVVRVGRETTEVRVGRAEWPAGIVTLVLLLVAASLLALLNGLAYPSRARVTP